MKLALVSAKFPFGGKEPYLHAELRALAPFFESIVVFPTSPQTTEIGFRSLSVAVERRGLLAATTLRDALLAIAIRPRESASAIVALISGSYLIKNKLKNMVVVPLGLALGYRLRRDGFHHVHSYWLSTPATVAFLAAQVAGIPWSSTAHLWDIYENNALATKLQSANFVRAISERGRKDLLATAGCDQAAVSVVHVGVDVPPLKTIESTSARRPFKLLCAANLVLKKGHADLLSALTQLTNSGIAIHCTIAGDGELRDELHAEMLRNKLENVVTFRGHVPHDILLAEIRAGQYHSMVLPSLERAGGLMEGIPVALMEAMALGLPVISTATGSITELVDNTCGRVVPQSDPTALAKAIQELASDPAVCSKLARAAHDMVATHFNVCLVAQRLATLIRSDASSALL